MIIVVLSSSNNSITVKCHHETIRITVIKQQLMTEEGDDGNGVKLQPNVITTTMLIHSMT